MVDDRLVHMDHIIAIEATMDEMKSQHQAIHQLLQDIPVIPWVFLKIGLLPMLVNFKIVIF